MSKAVRFDGYGGIDVLRVVEVERPVPGTGQVLVEVKAAAINPGEAAIREGADGGEDRRVTGVTPATIRYTDPRQRRVRIRAR